MQLYLVLIVLTALLRLLVHAWLFERHVRIANHLIDDMPTETSRSDARQMLVNAIAERIRNGIAPRQRASGDSAERKLGNLWPKR
jgi:hypothetical protein